MTDELSGNQVFGLTSSNNLNESGKAYATYVFRVLANGSDGDIPKENQDFKRIRADILEDSYLMGMKPTMDYQDSKYQIHCIYMNTNTLG